MFFQSSNPVLQPLFLREIAVVVSLKKCRRVKHRGCKMMAQTASVRAIFDDKPRDGLSGCGVRWRVALRTRRSPGQPEGGGMQPNGICPFKRSVCGLQRAIWQ